MIIDSPIISGSLASTGSLTQIGNVVITGSLSVSGPIKGNITGSADSASFATSASYSQNADLLDGLNSTAFVYTSSYNQDSSSFSLRVTNTELTGSSLVTASGSFSTRVTTLENSSASFAQQSGSNSVRLTNLEVTASVLTTASASFAVVSSSFALTSGSDSTRITNLESTASILTTASGSFAVVSSSFSTTSGSLSTRVTTLESASSSFAIVSQSFSSTSQSVSNRVSVIESSYATTGSNIFSGTQGVSNVSNAISFTSTASLYLDGGARITKDLYVSGTSYFNNVTIYGTQSVNYITSSQLNIGTNIITVNTDTPTVRYGGLAVYDSGSTGLTGSLLWDSENNHWIYTNPSASTYSGGMLISGPRASARGCEVGTTSCALMMGQGGDHITSSAIFHYGNATCFYNNTVVGSGGTVCTTMINSACVGIGTTSPGYTLDVNGNARIGTTSSTIYGTLNVVQNSTSSPNWVRGIELIHPNGTGVTGGYIGISLTGQKLGAIQVGDDSAAGNLVINPQGGNLGLGVTPSAWDGYTGFQIGTQGSIGATSTVINFSQNVYYGAGGNAYIANGKAAMYQMNDGEHGWRVAGTGNANCAITFTQAMTIFNSGIACFACQVCAASFNAPEVNIGTSLSGYALTVKEKGCTSAPFMAFIGSASNGSWMRSYWFCSDATTTIAQLTVQPTDNMYFGSLVAMPLILQTSNANRLTIASTGAACFACELTAKSLGTNDLILNNLNYECANYVDGTRGSWLIQEGACDLFIINQVSCKKYKFNLIEIE